MRIAQHLIKAFALFLAAIIIISVFSAIVGGIALLAGITGDDEWGWGDNTGPWVSTDYENQGIRELDINVKATSVRFRTSRDGEKVKVDTNNEYITTWIDGERLNVIEKSHGVFGWGGSGDLIIYVREDVKFDDVKIEVGAGTLHIESLDTKQLDLNLGAGKSQISNLVVHDHARINGGAGKVDLYDENLQDAEIKLGVGKTDIRAKLTGRSKIESGVGKLDLDLLGEERDYRITIDKGLGSVHLGSQSLDDGAVYGDGNNYVDIESGVGAVDIRFVRN